jgi:hypothetical protein
MARVYSGSRLMLDPNFILSARRAADEREAAARDVRKDISRGIGEIGASIGGAVDYALERKARNERREMMENAPDIADPEYKAAVERFVETGDIGGLNAYRTIKEGRERMAREAEARGMELAIRKQEADAMAKKMALEDKKVKDDLISKAKFDLREAEIDYRTAETQGDRDKAKVNIDRALKNLMNAGEDVSGYRYPDGTGATKPETGTEPETPKIGDSIKAQINNFKIRLDAGFETPEEKEAFIADIDKARAGATSAEESAFVELRQKANKTKDKTTKENERIEGEKAKARHYAEMLKEPSKMYIWIEEKPDEVKEYKKFYEKYGG